MTDFVRRLVSGGKARYKDEELDVELDLAYITDRVIVMGYPATGIEGLYRNRREDARKFLNHRHGKNYWVFNFCPVKENTYPPTVFDGRVSRYPFPDHHSPPLALLPLVSREIRTWLDGSKDRIAVLHCKAGKGRSGTLACVYLLSLEVPRQASLERSKSTSERVTERAEELMNAMPADESLPEAQGNNEKSEVDLVKQELSIGQTAPRADVAKSSTSLQSSATTDALNQVLDLHTSRRMRRSPSPSSGKKHKAGVSIPSQRRWLYYWTLLLAHHEPPDFWSLDPEVQHKPAPKVRLIEFNLRFKELSGIKSSLVKAANAVIDRTGLGKVTSMKAEAMSRSKGQIWVSLARYDDDLVETLEKWEKHTRSEDGDLGKRKPGSEHMEDEEITEIFKSGKWDKGKMVRSFARLGTIDKDSIQHEDTSDGKIFTHVLRPLTSERWDSIRHDIEEDTNQSASTSIDGPVSEENSIYDVTHALTPHNGVVLNAHREVRAKLYMGQVFMGWFWFIPTFHMPHPRSAGESTTLRLSKKEIDFPVGIGANIIDVEVKMEWAPEVADVVSPPARQGSQESREGKGEPSGLAATVKAVAAGDIREMAEVKQAAED
ncbi:phosphatases II, partial [Panus rudis PR-1116 ss-1]